MGILDIFKKKKPMHKVAFVSTTGNSTVIWSEDDYITYAKETYMENVIAFQCINQIARAVSSVPWKLMKANTDGTMEEILDWKLKRLFAKPNRFESFDRFVYKVMAYLLIKGDSYVWGNSTQNKLPSELLSLRPDMITIKTDSKGYPTAYVYNNGNTKETYEVDPITGHSEILHMKTFHPLDELYGMPPAKPASKDVDISNEGTKWNMKLMVNEARPGMIVTMSGFLTDEQHNQLKEEMNKHSGADNAGKNLLIESENGVVDVKPYNWSPKDIDFIEGGRETARKICIGFGVPPMLLGIPGDNTYSNYKEARLAFWEDTVFYYLNNLVQEFNCWLFGTGDDIKYGETVNQQLTLVPDLSNIPALADKQDQLWDRQNKAKDILRINERREMLGYDPIDGGDVILVSASMLPLESAIEDPQLVDNEDDEDEL